MAKLKLQVELKFDNIGISSNVIATRQGGGNQLFIDPYPDGLSNEGTLSSKVTYKLMVQQLRLTLQLRLLMTQS